MGLKKEKKGGVIQKVDCGVSHSNKLPVSEMMSVLEQSLYQIPSSRPKVSDIGIFYQRL